MDPFGDEVAAGEIAEEADLGFRPQAAAEQIDDLGDDEGRNDQRAWMRLEQIEAGAMVAVVAVDVGIEGAGVNEKRDQATSARRISSIRSDTSDSPLAPAPAARRRRRPFTVRPRCASMASRVNSDTVVPRLCAS